MASETTNPVNPAHYKAGDIECIDAIKAALTPEEYRGMLKGTVMKYIWRVGLKGRAVTDVEKALWYLNRLADHYREVENTTTKKGLMESTALRGFFQANSSTPFANVNWSTET